MAAGDVEPGLAGDVRARQPSTFGWLRRTAKPWTRWSRRSGFRFAATDGTGNDRGMDSLHRDYMPKRRPMAASGTRFGRIPALTHSRSTPFRRQVAGPPPERHDRRSRLCSSALSVRTLGRYERHLAPPKPALDALAELAASRGFAGLARVFREEAQGIPEHRTGRRTIGRPSHTCDGGVFENTLLKLYRELPDPWSRDPRDSERAIETLKRWGLATYITTGVAAVIAEAATSIAHFMARSTRSSSGPTPSPTKPRSPRWCVTRPSWK